MARADLEVLLDGSPVTLPPGQRSLSGIRTYLEALALEQERVLCTFKVDGIPVPSGQSLPTSLPYRRVEGESFDLEQMPLELVRTARRQARFAQNQVQSGVGLVLINEGTAAREYAWSLTKLLKEPLLTLNFLPEKLWGRSYHGVSASKLRKWQLQQLGGILRELDEAAGKENPQVLAEALESRALPWLDSLMNSLDLWYETLQGELQPA